MNGLQVSFALASLTLSAADLSRNGIIPPRDSQERHPGDIVPGTTKSNIPEVLKVYLNKICPINETISDRYAAAEAVKILESRVGWDVSTSSLKKPEYLNSVVNNGVGNNFQECGAVGKEELLNELLRGREVYEMMDIVVPTIRDLDFLVKWKPFVHQFHFILIQDGDSNKQIKVPEWVDYELFNRRDIDSFLGNDSWIISTEDASIRNFGFLVSKKPYVWTVDDDCFPANDKNGNPINVIHEHMLNLLLPATPYFFNTVYDPYQPCVDFVRGYPYSLRAGVKTAISHGLWMNMYDYDAPTQLLKPAERNTKMVDISMTVPKGVLYPMCSMNVAFSRELIGPAFMQGLMGRGQPWGRYDDMFAGWASKVVADHIGVGVKSGAPYIYHQKASNPFRNLEKEYMGLQWQEDVIRFMDRVQLSASSTTAALAYTELAEEVDKHLSKLSPYFTRLASAMKIWVTVWTEMESGVRAPPVPSRKQNQNITTDIDTDTDSSNNSTTAVHAHHQTIEKYGVAVNASPHNLYNVIFPQVAAPKVVYLPKCAANIKVFVYDLPYQFHGDVLDDLENIINKQDGTGSNCNMRGECIEVQRSGDYSAQRQYAAEVAILAKLLLLPRVDNPDDADLIVVPFFSALAKATLGCPWKRTCGPYESLVADLFRHLVHYKGANIAKHVFLCTRDTRDCSASMRVVQQHGARLLTYGPMETSNLTVVPPSDAGNNMHAQMGPRKVPERLVFLMIGLINDERQQWYNYLQNIASEYNNHTTGNSNGNGNGTSYGTSNGSVIELHEIIAHRDYPISPKQVYEFMGSTVFCPISSGDLPYQHRFFDAIVLGCIPIIVTRQFRECESWFMNNPQDDLSTCWKKSYPFVDMIDWPSVVIRIQHRHFNEATVRKTIFDFPKAEIIKMRTRLSRIRHLLMYDWNSRSADAFTMLIHQLICPSKT